MSEPAILDERSTPVFDGVRTIGGSLRFADANDSRGLAEAFALGLIRQAKVSGMPLFKRK